MTVQVDGLNAVDIGDNPLMLAQCVVCYHEARCNAMAVTVGWVFEAPKDEQQLQLDVEMMFSGFRFLESRPEVMEGLAKYAGIPGHKWGIQASGVLILGPAACKKVFGEPWPNVPVFTQEQSTRISMFI
jgi:hypothetical protein